MTRLCDFIERESGLNQEGLFRISANVRLVERLKHSFDESGDAPLEESGDVAAAAALLKQFLRELPQPVIPSHLNQPFFSAIRSESCLQETHSLIPLSTCVQALVWNASNG